jgi:N-acetylneuraminate synthase
MKILEMFKNPPKREIVRPYIIAEAGVNHEGSMDTAKRLIEEAKEGGAHAIKFQTYKAETIASKDSPAYWDLTKEPTDSQFKLFKKHDKFWKDEYVKLKEHCDKMDIEFMSTPFDIESTKFLNELMPVFKVSSSDITNKPFIKFICDFNKPILLSTGASYLYEIEEAVEWIENKNIPLALLHCVLSYPTDDKNAHLGMIRGLKKKFPDYMVGYSDHTLPKDMKVVEMATLLGSVIIEKHFTHDKKLQGNDHYHAMDMHDLKIFNKNLDEILTIIGDEKVSSIAKEKSSRANARRSLVAKIDIPKGKVVEYDDLTWKRPASGISPRSIDEIIGKAALKDIASDDILKWEFFKS